MTNSADPDQLASSVSWLPKKSTDLDLHCLQRWGISGISRTRVDNLNYNLLNTNFFKQKSSKSKDEYSSLDIGTSIKGQNRMPKG